MIEVRLTTDDRECDFCNQRAIVLLIDRYTVKDMVKIEETLACAHCLAKALQSWTRVPKRSRSKGRNEK